MAATGLAMYTEVQPRRMDELVEDYAPLVKRIANHLLARLPASVQVDDLIQSGMVGLLEAARNYDGSKGASFETYASIRIRGAMLDEIRKGDWVPRSVHRKNREVSEAIKQIENRTGRDAKDHDIAEYLGISLNEYYTVLKDAAGGRLFSFEELLGEGESVTEGIGSGIKGPLEGLQKNNFQDNLASAIKKLPEREQLVLALYYDEELNLKEIGQVLGVSESRVSQIHSQAALRLRTRLTDWQSA